MTLLVPVLLCNINDAEGSRCLITASPDTILNTRFICWLTRLLLSKHWYASDVSLIRLSGLSLHYSESCWARDDDWQLSLWLWWQQRAGLRVMDIQSSSLCSWSISLSHYIEISIIRE